MRCASGGINRASILFFDSAHFFHSLAGKNKGRQPGKGLSACKLLVELFIHTLHTPARHSFRRSDGDETGSVPAILGNFVVIATAVLSIDALDANHAVHNFYVMV
jgi:hypothetical protein